MEDFSTTTDASGEISNEYSKYRVSVNLDETLFVSIVTREGAGANTGKRSAISRPHEIVYFDGQSTVIQSRDAGIGAYVFDPRTLGVATGPYEKTALSRALRLGTILQSGRVLGEEDVGNSRCTVVEVRESESTAVTFWIGEEDKVLKFSYQIEGVWNEVVECSYSDTFTNAILPIETLTKAINLVTGVKVELRRKLSEYKKIVPQAFSYADMNIPVGNPVSDIRIGRRLGYWDGQGLSETLPTAAVDTPRLNKPDGSASKSFFAIATLLLLMVTGAAFWFSLRSKAT